MEIFSMPFIMMGLVILILTLIIVFLLNLFLTPFKKTELEAGLEPVYTSIAGGMIGRVRYKGPFIHLRLYNDFMIIACQQPFLLRYKEIENIHVEKWFGRISDRIQIEHHNQEIPARIIVGTSNPDDVKTFIEKRKSSISYNSESI
ncbi:MAG: hypothetical protein JEY99_19135 [Spirochaetales bacterium]|nr:hypothetical protein [Spirochaetales bacterium]